MPDDSVQLILPKLLPYQVLAKKEIPFLCFKKPGAVWSSFYFPVMHDDHQKSACHQSPEISVDPHHWDHKYDKRDPEQEGDRIVKQRGFGLPKTVQDTGQGSGKIEHRTQKGEHPQEQAGLFAVEYDQSDRWPQSKK